jgi:anaerobic magnesium-protoporphyrin IX monomethyl ester cyclase
VPGLNILVIVPRYNTGSGYHYNPEESTPNFSYYLPAGLAYIVSSLKSAGFDVDVLNPNHSPATTRDAIRSAFFTKDYRLVFTGGVSLNFPVIRDIVKYVREMSACPVVVGGGIITAQPDTMFDLILPDVAVIGEGEQTCIEIAQAIENGTSMHGIRGIVFRNEDGLIEFNIPRDTITDLDTLPFPDYESMGFRVYLDNQKCSFLYDHFDYPRPYPILASRNCTHNCTFCFHTTGRKYRQRSLDNVMDEVRQAIAEYEINLFFFYDELFASSEQRVFEFCERFKELRDAAGYEITFTVELRVDSITGPMLDALKGAGCTEVCLGLESYSQPVLDSMRKHITPSQIKDALELITSKGLAPVGNFIFGDPAETLDTARETLDFFRTRQDILHGCRVTFIIPFQGSAIYKEMVRRGVIADETEFIEDRAERGYDFHHPFDMTSLSAPDFESLKDMVFTAHYTQGTYVVPDEIEDGYATIICPFCGKQSTYRNLPPIGHIGLTNVGCRHCNARFEMVRWYYLSIVKPVIKWFGLSMVLRFEKMLEAR